MAKGSSSAAVLERKRRNREAQDERAERNRFLKLDGAPTPWEKAKSERWTKRMRLRQMGALPTQPRNSDGYIVKKDAEGHEILVECCPKCTREARVRLTSEAEAKAADRASQASRRKARATSRRADSKPVGRSADSRRKTPRGA
jgi:hypothetical protein